MGNCTLDFNDPGNSDYVAATQVVQVVSVGQAANTITVTSTPPANATVTGTYTPTATASSGDAVVITVSTPPPRASARSAGGLVTFNHVGNCTLDFNDPGNSDYVAATQVVQVVSVGQAANAITVTSTPPANATVNRHLHPDGDGQLGRHRGDHRRPLLFGRLLDHRGPRHL